MGYRTRGLPVPPRQELGRPTRASQPRALLLIIKRLKPSRWVPPAAVTALAIVLLLWPSVLAPREPIPVAEQETLNVGFTFSRRQAEYLGLPWHETFQAAVELSPRLIRLGAYWDEMERQPGDYDFSTLDWLLDQAARRDLQVILTVGMKAPRWPEYFLPRWLERRLVLPHGARVSDDALLRRYTLDFIEQVVRRYRDREVIAYWQVENEPLDPSGPHRWRIGADFLAEEVALVRMLDYRERPIIVNMFVDTHPLASLPPWRNDAERRARTILKVADILGLDVYPSLGIRILSVDLYLNWSRWVWEKPVVELQHLAHRQGKEAWVIEAQAEPWEPARVVYTDYHESKSVRPSTAAGTFQRLQAAGFQTILLWGVEHWYMRLQRHEDASWWEKMGTFFVPNPNTTSTTKESEAVVAEPLADQPPHATIERSPEAP